MSADEMRLIFRRLVGNPTPQAVSKEEIDVFLMEALQMMADELQYETREEPALIGLVANQRAYDLPTDMGLILWVAHNNNPLTARSSNEWERDSTDFRASASSGTLSEYAIIGRRLWLNPPPAAAAVTTSALLTVRYAAYPTKIPHGGVRGLSELDSRLAARWGAMLYCEANPTEENMYRCDKYAPVVEDQLGRAKRRHAYPIDAQEPSFAPDVNRYGGAR